MQPSQLWCDQGVSVQSQAARLSGRWVLVKCMDQVNGGKIRWMMGAPPGWCGDLSRTAAIRGYGNGVVVQVGEAMGRWLLVADTEEPDE